MKITGLTIIMTGLTLGLIGAILELLVLLNINISSHTHNMYMMFTSLGICWIMIFYAFIKNL